MTKQNIIINDTISYFSVLALIFLCSHPFQALFQVNEKLIFLTLSFLLCTIFFLFRRNVDKKIIYWILLIFLCSILAFSLTGFILNLQVGFLSAVIFFLAYQTSDFIFSKKIINFLYFISLTLLIFCWLGYFYAYFGGSSFFSLINPETEGKYKFFFYLFTFTNTVDGNFIRPSAIFDEPGSLVFFITSVVVIMEINKFSKSKSFLLLFLLNITGSLVSVILFFLYLFFKFKLNKKLLIFLLIFIIVYIFKNNLDFIDYLSARTLNIDSLIFNNRTTQIISFFENVDKDTFLYGKDLSLNKDLLIDQTSNPFSILWAHGIFMSIPYFLIEIWLLYKFLFGKKQNKFSLIAIFLTLLQRPYIYSLYWGFVIVYPIIHLYKSEKLNLKKLK